MKWCVGALALGCLLGGCGRPPDDRVQGYVEGEFVYVSSPIPGTLEVRSVRRGMPVQAGDPLFVLESAAERAEREHAARRLEEGEAKLADAKKGLRTSELAALEAQLNQASAALVLSEKEFQRQSDLATTQVSSVQEFDRARALRDQDRQRVAQLEADLKTGTTGARSDQIAAAEANVRALAAALARADWDLAQKRQPAPQAGLVFDTLYEPGEWVPAGRPVIVLLPPANLKVRAFVPETRLGSLPIGAPARVFVDGETQPLSGNVRFISPQAEYTPPVIYSQASRAKLVFMVEIEFAPNDASKLHPGQPVDVQF